jgi:hypothetical protein
VWSGRSGSTILDNILGQLDGFFSTGELRYLWERGLTDQRPCGCGKPFADCEVWQGILFEAYGEDLPDAAAMMQALARATRIRALPKVLLRRSQPPVSQAEIEVLDRLYRAVARATGAQVVVDSSKLPPYALLVSKLPSVDFVAVHLVRDPRATAYSWSRSRPLPDYDGQRLMQRLPAWKAALLWMQWNTLAAALWRHHPRYLRVRYEDFVADPQACIREIAESVDGSPPLPFTGPRTVHLTRTHSVAGNPSRFSSGEVTLRPDVEWTKKMRRVDRVVVTAFTAPALRGFGYRLRSTEPAEAGR